MFKRIMLSLTFVAAFGLVGVATPDTSEGRRYWRRPYVARYYAPPPRVYYRSHRPYYNYYGAPSYYGYPGDYYYGPPRGGVYFRFGF